MSLGLMRALAPEVPEVRLSNRQRPTQPQKDDFAPYASKSVPQRLKPSLKDFYGTAKAVPFVQRRFFPQPSLRDLIIFHITQD